MNDTNADVLAAASGDPLAYRRLVDRHRSLVTSIALAQVRDRQISEDVAQEVFLQAWVGLGRLRNPDSFLPWLREITRNHSLHAQRTRTRQRIDHAADLGISADPRPSLTEQLLTAEEERVLSDALDRLPDDAREVLTLFHREGRSTQQVAELLGLSDSAVRKRLSRAREALKEDVERAFGEAAKKSAPNEAFTAAVVVGLARRSPGSVLPRPRSGLRWVAGLGAAAALVAVAISATRPPATVVPVPTPAEIATRRSVPIAPVAPPPPSRAAALPAEAAPTADTPLLTASIFGTVEGVDGRPAAGAEVVALGPATGRASADAQGAFQLMLAEGSYRLIAWHGANAGALAEPVQLGRGAVARKVVLRLGPASKVTGKVVSAADGRPVAGASVVLTAPDGAALRSANADADGAFSWVGVPTTELELVAVSRGFAATLRPHLQLDPGAAVTVELEPEAILEGIVVDSTGAPISGAEIHVNKPIGGGPRLGDAQPNTFSQPDGTFRLAGLQKGPARMGARSGARNAPNTVITLEAGKTTHLELKLVDNAALRGTVRSAGGKPLRGKVYVRAAPKRMSDETGMMPRYDDVRPDGTYELSLLPGDYLVGTFVEGSMQDLKASTPLTLAPGTTQVQDLTVAELVEGTVVDPSGAALGGVTVTLRPPDFAAARACQAFEGVSDAEGHFLFPRVTCSPTFSAAAHHGGEAIVQTGLSAAASDLRLQLQRPGRVRGTIRGGEIHGFRLRVEQTPWKNDWLEFTGDHFELPEVPAVPFELHCETAAGLEGRARVALAQGGTQDVTLELAPKR